MSSESNGLKRCAFWISLSSPPGRPAVDTQEAIWRVELRVVSLNHFRLVRVLAQGVEPTVAAAHRAALAARRRFGVLPEFSEVH